MRTPFLLLAISIISLNSSSLLFDGNGNFLHGKVYKANPATDLIEMKNGDYSLDGIGSVSEELQEKGYDVKAYNSGLVTQSRALTMAESNSSLYIYTYDKDAITNYTQVSISFTNPTRIDDDNKITYQPEFELKDIQLVSVSSNHYLAKWKVLNFKPDTTKGHSYYLRELIGKNYYLPAPIICQFDPQKGKTYEEYGEVVVIKDKFVAWQNFAQGNVTKQPFQIDQMHYAVFNTNMDDQMDDLVKVEIEWDEQPFYGKTIVKKTETNPSANDLTNANYYKLMDSDINFKGNMIHRKEVIENKNITYKSYDQFWFWKRDEKEWNINTVGKLQDLKDRNPNNEILTDENITNQKWFVTFKQNTFTAGIPFVQEVVGVFTKLSYYKDFNIWV